MNRWPMYIAVFVGVILLNLLDIEGPYYIAAVIGLMAAITGFSIWKQKGQIKRLLKHPTPDGLLEHYKKTVKVKLLPQGDLIMAQSRAVSFAYYGQFEQAQKELASFPVQNFTGMARAIRLSAEVFIDILQNKVTQQTLEMARSAEDSVEIKKWMPAKDKLKNTYYALIEIGEVLTGNTDPHWLNNLELRFENANTMLKLLIAKTIVIAYKQQNRTDEANKIESWIKETAPHCIPLFQN